MAKNLRAFVGQLWKSLNPGKKPQSHKKNKRPSIELLEDRTVPATFGTVQGVAFLDANNSGTLNTGDARLAGVKVTLIGTTTGAKDNTSINVLATTSTTGGYKFTNVPEGSYKLVTATVPGLSGGASQTFTNVAISPTVLTFTKNFLYKGGIVSGSVSLRQFTTNATTTVFPYGTAGSGTAIGDNKPTVKTPITPISTTSSSANTVVNLGRNFKDLDMANSTVTFHITNGTTTHTVKLILFDIATPATVMNFFNYVINNAWDNSVFHRNAKKAVGGIGVLQGGALTTNTAGDVLTDVPVNPAGSKVPNEFSSLRKNLKGTIAMAQSGGDVNSATNQFFFNTIDNSAALDPQRFTIFGKVADAASMTALTTLAATATKDLTGGAFASAHPTSLVNAFPLTNYAGDKTTFSADAVLANYMRITDISIEKRKEFLTYSLVGTNGGGNAQVATASINNGYLTVDPLSAGTTTFTIMATDRYGATVTTTVNVTVTGNTAPTASDGTLTANEDTPATGTLTGSDVDAGNTLTFAIESQPLKGAVVLNNTATGAYTFNPGPDFHHLEGGATPATEQVTFTFKVTDNLGVSSLIKTVTVTVTGINDAPVAQNAGATTDQDNIVNGTLTATDVDDNSTVANFTVVDQPTEGTVSLNPTTGQFTFDPNGDFDDLGVNQSRPVTFTYKVTDDKGTDSAPATVTITVNGLNDPPTALNGTLAANPTTPVQGTLLGSDPDTNDPISFALLSAPGKGIVTLNDPDTGLFTFNPNGAFSGLASGESEVVTFSFQIVDSHSELSNIATITITVTAP